MNQLVARHLSEGHLKLLSNCFVFLLFGNKFVLKPVNLLLKLLDGFVGKLSTSLSLLQLGGQGLDLLIVGLLSLVSLLLGNLKGLEIVGDDSQLFFEFKDLCLSGICSLLSLLKIRLTGSELLGSFGIVSSSSSLVKLGVGLLEFLLGFLKVLLKAGYSSVQGVHLSLGSHQGLFLLLKLESDNSKPLRAEVKLGLQLSGLGSQLGHFILSLGCSELGGLGGLLALVGSVTGVVLLDLR